MACSQAVGGARGANGWRERAGVGRSTGAPAGACQTPPGTAALRVECPLVPPLSLTLFLHQAVAHQSPQGLFGAAGARSGEFIRRRLGAGRLESKGRGRTP